MNYAIRIRCDAFPLWLGIALSASVALADTKIWTGGGANNNASTPDNWGGTAPVTGDSIVLDGSTHKNMTWDAAAPQSIASWLQYGYVGTVTISTVYSGTFTNLQITGDCVISNGMWTHLSNSSLQTNRLHVTVDGIFILDTSAQINVDKKGFSAAQGPGRCTSAGDGGGASHGGQGQLAQAAIVYGTYGSITNPITIGSGANQSGGGAIRLVVGNAATINGSMYARGGTQAGSWAGPGAGGSIFLTVSNLTGNGTLNADGGSHDTDNNGAGAGGGRIAIKLTATDATTFGSLTLRAYGGTAFGRTGWDGAAGTIYREKGTESPGMGELIINNNGRSSSMLTDLAGQVSGGSDPSLRVTIPVITLLNAGILGVGANDTLVLSNAVVTGYSANQSDGITVRGILAVDPAFAFTNYYINIITSTASFYPTTSITIGTNATLIVNMPYTNSCNVTIQAGGNLRHSPNGSTALYKLNYTILGNLTVETAGQVNVSGRGYANGGPGISGASGVYGASYGGKGGGYSGGVSGPCYGSILAPTWLGSDPSGAGGGGAIRLTVTGTTTLNGSMTADAITHGNGNGGAGGSVWLTTSNLIGNGSISANGAGCSTYSDKGQGGGGRIAVILTGSTSFGNITMTAYTGNDLGVKGGAGTIYRSTPASSGLLGNVTVDNDNRGAGSTHIPPTANAVANELAESTLTLTNSCTMLLTGNMLVQNLWLKSAGSILNLNSYTLSVQEDEHSLAPGTVQLNGGSILWLGPLGGTLFYVQ